MSTSSSASRYIHNNVYLDIYIYTFRRLCTVDNYLFKEKHFLLVPKGLKTELIFFALLVKKKVLMTRQFAVMKEVLS